VKTRMIRGIFSALGYLGYTLAVLAVLLWFLFPAASVRAWLETQLDGLNPALTWKIQGLSFIVPVGLAATDIRISDGDQNTPLLRIDRLPSGWTRRCCGEQKRSPLVIYPANPGRDGKRQDFGRPGRERDEMFRHHAEPADRPDDRGLAGNRANRNRQFFGTVYLARDVATAGARRPAGRFCPDRRRYRPAAAHPESRPPAVQPHERQGLPGKSGS